MKRAIIGGISKKITEARPRGTKHMLYFTKNARFTKDSCYCVALCTDDKDEQAKHTLKETRHSSYGYCVVLTSIHKRSTQQVGKRYLYKGLAEKALLNMDIE